VLAGFYDARGQTVGAYCAEVCPPELVSEAALASLVDFMARVRAAGQSDPNLDDLLIKGTRTAASARVTVEQPPGTLGRVVGRRKPHPVDGATCRVMPELLAAYANGEFPGEDREIRRHTKGCNVCRTTASRLERAERAFADASVGGAPPDVREAWLEFAAAGADVDVAMPPPEEAGILPDEQAETVSDDQAETMPDEQAETMPDEQAETMPDEQAETMPDEQAETMAADGPSAAGEAEAPAGGPESPPVEADARTAAPAPAPHPPPPQEASARRQLGKAIRRLGRLR
jgi:hypothetical protein